MAGGSKLSPSQPVSAPDSPVIETRRKISLGTKRQSPGPAGRWRPEPARGSSRGQASPARTCAPRFTSGARSPRACKGCRHAAAAVGGPCPKEPGADWDQQRPLPRGLRTPRTPLRLGRGQKARAGPRSRAPAWGPGTAPAPLRRLTGLRAPRLGRAPALPAAAAPPPPRPERRHRAASPGSAARRQRRAAGSGRAPAALRPWCGTPGGARSLPCPARLLRTAPCPRGPLRSWRLVAPGSPVGPEGPARWRKQQRLVV